jgi:hypothetical protein
LRDERLGKRTQTSRNNFRTQRTALLAVIHKRRAPGRPGVQASVALPVVAEALVPKAEEEAEASLA